MRSLLPRDKILHVLAGGALFAVGQLLAGPLIGAVLCVGFGAAKEAWDRLSGTGNAEAGDFLATCAGGVLAALALAAPALLRLA
ncbi:hypothetical protein [Caldimonas tepidiphila]|uniref:hypothetical protein n=1 Tax=Caldimonas tepidiphila TaxID=2315841 RepID=UPI000E5AFD90|nr:hypothetical protein [Caldimonas tepidiphila]